MVSGPAASGTWALLRDRERGREREGVWSEGPWPACPVHPALSCYKARAVATLGSWPFLAKKALLPCLTEDRTGFMALDEGPREHAEHPTSWEEFSRTMERAKLNLRTARPLSRVLAEGRGASLLGRTPPSSYPSALQGTLGTPCHRSPITPCRSSPTFKRVPRFLFLLVEISLFF